MVKVLYIMGSGRSGSTIIGNILGSQARLSHHGEICYLSRNLRDRNVLCGCQTPFVDCSLWSPVIENAFGDANLDELAHTLDFNRRGYSGRRVIKSMAGKAPADPEYLDALGRLYQTLAEQTGSSVLIDSSKTPSYAQLLAQVEGIELYLLHLVRDPRAVAYSWARKVKRTDTLNDAEFQEVFTTNNVALRWFTWNLTAEAHGLAKTAEFMRVRYEDFIQHPATTLQKMLDFVGYEGELRQVGENQFDVAVNHTVWGNPNRIKTGPVVVAPDNEWEQSLDKGQKRQVWMRTFPLCLRYGYYL